MINHPESRLCTHWNSPTHGITAPTAATTKHLTCYHQNEYQRPWAADTHPFSSTRLTWAAATRLQLPPVRLKPFKLTVATGSGGHIEYSTAPVSACSTLSQQDHFRGYRFVISLFFFNVIYNFNSVSIVLGQVHSSRVSFK